MANDVFANGREISCKAADGKAVCAFPDVCMTPPENPATPPGVPIPYPNTGMASDTSDGSATVKIGGKEIMLKDKSYFKKSVGDEAGCAAKKGVITSVHRGKVYFNSWSMDVMVEGENAVRHLDLTTHNHASRPGQTPTWPYLDSMSISPAHPCKEDMDKEAEACKDFKPHKKGGPSPCPPDKPLYDEQKVEQYATKTAGDNCLAARRCQLVPYAPKGRGAKRQPGCCPGQTPHHMIEASSFFESGRGPADGSVPLRGTEGYDADKAPCICVEGTNQYHGTHGLMHAYQSTAAAQSARSGTVALANGSALSTEVTDFGTARQQSIEAATKTFPQSGCNPKCLESQINAYHRDCGIKDRTPIKSVQEGYVGSDAVEAADMVVANRSRRLR